MKKLLLFATITASIGLFIASCGSNADKDPIAIPDSANVGKIIPVIQGNIDTLFSVVPNAYMLEFNDTAAVLTFKLRHDKAYGIPNAFCTTSITDGDTTDITKYPYVVLLDSTGNEIDGVKLQLDPDNYRDMERLISSRIKGESELNFYTKDRVDYDRVAANARNFKLVAGIANVPDTAKISQLILDFSTQVTTLNNKWSRNTRPKYKNQMNEFLIDRGTVEVTEQEADKAVPYMRPDQLTRYKRVKVQVKHLKLDDEFDEEMLH